MALTAAEKLAKKKKSEFFNFVKNTLRRASYRWKPRGEAEKLARVDRGLYKCAHCEGIFKRGEVELDHVDPVIAIKEGFTNWDDFITRLFCDVDGYQMLCKGCHDAKTMIEDTLRAEYNAKRKELDKKEKEE